MLNKIFYRKSNDLLENYNIKGKKVIILKELILKSICKISIWNKEVYLIIEML